MNITVFENHTSPNKYLLRYRATHDKVIEGLFTIEDQDGKKTSLTEAELYSLIEHGMKHMLYSAL